MDQQNASGLAPRTETLGNGAAGLPLALARPIQAHGEEVRHLTFRQLTTKDIRALGMPFGFGKDGASTPDTAVIGRYVVALAGIPSSSVDQLSPPDFMAAMGVVMDFFASAKDG